MSTTLVLALHSFLGGDNSSTTAAIPYSKLQCRRSSHLRGALLFSFSRQTHEVVLPTWPRRCRPYPSCPVSGGDFSEVLGAGNSLIVSRGRASPNFGGR